MLVCCLGFSMSSSQAHGHLYKLETDRNAVLGLGWVRVRESQLVKEPLITKRQFMWQPAFVCLFVCQSVIKIHQQTWIKFQEMLIMGQRAEQVDFDAYFSNLYSNDLFMAHLCPVVALHGTAYG